MFRKVASRTCVRSTSTGRRRRSVSARPPPSRSDMEGKVEGAYALVVEVGEGGRLDRFVSDRLELSRTRVQALLADGRVKVEGRPARKSEAVQPGMRIEVVVPPPAAVDIPAEELPL